MLQLVLNAAARVFTRTRSIYPPSAWIMEKPCILTTMFGPQNVYEDFKPCIEKHFTIIKYEDFVERKEHLAGKIRAIFLFGTDLEVNMELLQALPNLQAVVNGGVGVDHLDIPLIKSFGMKVCNTPHVVDNATADLGIALMLASSRRIIEGHNFSKYHELEYMPKCFGNDVSGATLGIIGMGRIGYKVAKRAQGFDMRILYHNRNQRTVEDERAVGAVYCEKMEELLQKSDFVIIVVSLTPQTHKLIGAKELAMMKPSSTLINISRGLVVDQDALVDALKKKVIRAAALDVTYPEPLPKNHPLLSFPNVIVLPHMGTDTVETIQAMLEKMVVNTLAVLNGEQPPDEVHV
ncbi:glyoxylate/hydroxypyruvate reductase B isoform X2 [Neoarius graeffei]|uniref:glyoxylate/hydroxypyruvate reductase B isoform X2 n=1 Tax=Neoarius graeffei TaxID=443677 RepID=UPI00298C4418|nr:glyoxylate/hydroxypyruvate reductase B isoform X2 [Neoarius graeffei]